MLYEKYKSAAENELKMNYYINELLVSQLGLRHVLENVKRRN